MVIVFDLLFKKKILKDFLDTRPPRLLLRHKALCKKH